jgi:hypothetical protein
VLSGAVALAQTNILTNGDFEADPEGTMGGGTNVIDTSSITGWRIFAVGDATGTATVTSAAGKTGKGISLVRGAPAGADSAFDKDDPALREPIPAEERVYKLTVDVRDGAQFGGTPAVTAEIQFVDPSFNRGAAVDPGAQFETFGLSAVSELGGSVSARFGVGGEERSVHLDNATLVDATTGVNRMINGGFENSASNLINWRFFDTLGGAGTATRSSDARTGAAAALLDVTQDPIGGDIGLDVDPFRVAVISGEDLTLSFAAKAVTLPTADTRLLTRVAGFDATGAFTGEIVQELVNPTTTAYGASELTFTVPDGVAAVNVSFRVWDELISNLATGAYLIDDVSVVREAVAGPGDFDMDLDVDGNDFLIWQRGNGAPGGVAQGNANDDGIVDGADLQIWKDRFGSIGGVATAAAVPEPLTAPLFILGFAAVGVLTRRVGLRAPS